MSVTAWRPERRRLADQVSDKIKQRILDRTYEPGHRLPAERILADELGITRLTLREALKVTEEAGFTQTRHGAGTFVQDVWENATLRLLGEVLNAKRALGPEEIEGLLEFRMVVTGGFVEAMVANHRPEQVRRLFEIVAEEREHLRDVDRLMELDWELYLQLVAASGNRIHWLLAQSVEPAYRYLSRIVYGAVDSLEPIVDCHESIARALEAGDVERLRHEINFFVNCGNAIIQGTINTCDEQ